VAVGDPARLFRFWKYPLAVGAANEYSAAKLGTGRKDAKGFFGAMWDVAASGLGIGGSDRAKRLLPGYVGSIQLLLPWRDIAGRLQYSDLTWILPWGDIGEFGRGQVGKALASAGIPFPRQLEPGNPWLQVFVAAMSGGKDPFTGQEIVPPLSPPDEALTAISRWLVRLWLPDLAPAGRGFEELAAAARGRTIGPEGQQVPSPGVAAVSRFLGLRTRALDPEFGLRLKSLELRKEADRVRQRARRLALAGRTEEAEVLLDRFRQRSEQFAKEFGLAE